MDPCPIPINVCKLQESNETKIEETFKEIHEKFIKVQQESKSLRVEVKKMEHEVSRLEKEEHCLESKNKVLEEEIAQLRSQTEEAVNAEELLKWKMYKINLIREFEQKNNEPAYKIIQEQKEHSEDVVIETEEIDQIPVPIEKGYVSEMEAKIAQLKDEIEKEKQNIQMTDPKLLTNMKMLEKRNAALLIRYQRQIGEATRRYRQTLAEVNSLKRILAVKSSMLADTCDPAPKK
ncbi:uncharacterized protein LOC128995219 [Macrosteles quadrilineatus]|uniref:uncharacterized protein LOC128995219 n=1 Tax=Macrosteles quadrilineatus TaxID=74068 RepID=UPI0023E24955|nr:uncharacterized protein LOC128995219 [Macrosteles quadrilineatus]XP_054276134.1 uncharacterized protein LOC128995219 [Macrosteles quadrilineatus]XP_054276135.1 uncharacterized protein LOC128995219 [Macrosteles quadrilineatus]XP_054276136.1 uncharacterized protein LOC128995219 [Macrosteles quadrilineatus]